MVITHALAASCSEAQYLWSDYLQPILLACNTSIDDTTGCSPLFLAYGGHLITWCDIIHGLPSRIVYANDSSADQFIIALQTTIKEFGNQIASKTAVYKSGYDFQNQIYKKNISTGDLVLIHDDTVRPKFA